MNPQVFYISDTHFGHQGVCNFMRNDGVTKLRPWTDHQEMDEELVKRWNEVVRPQDKVYHLGDVVINKKFLPILARLNGKKCLVMGNHDIFDKRLYEPYFYDYRAYAVKGDFICSHIPLDVLSVERFKTNVHGHTHAAFVPDARWPSKPDSRYFCVSVEQIDYTPIEHGALVEAIKKRKQENPPPVNALNTDEYVKRRQAM